MSCCVCICCSTLRATNWLPAWLTARLPVAAWDCVTSVDRVPRVSDMAVTMPDCTSIACPKAERDRCHWSRACATMSSLESASSPARALCCVAVLRPASKTLKLWLNPPWATAWPCAMIRPARRPRLKTSSTTSSGKRLRI